MNDETLNLCVLGQKEFAIWSVVWMFWFVTVMSRNEADDRPHFQVLDDRGTNWSAVSGCASCCVLVYPTETFRTAHWRTFDSQYFRSWEISRNLTLRLLMSYIYIYIYMELLVKPEMLTSYIYGPTFGNAETVSFYLLHNVSTLNQCREVSCVTYVCKHFAS